MYSPKNLGTAGLDQTLSELTNLNINYLITETQNSHINEHLATVVRKISLLEGRNLEEDPTLQGGLPSALTDRGQIQQDES